MNKKLLLSLYHERYVVENCNPRWLEKIAELEAEIEAEKRAKIERISAIVDRVCVAIVVICALAALAFAPVEIRRFRVYSTGLSADGGRWMTRELTQDEPVYMPVWWVVKEKVTK